MQTISTHRIPWTSTKPTRIVAKTTNDERIIRSLPDTTEDEVGRYGDELAMHIVVARELAKKIGWEGTMIAGSTRDGYTFVFAIDHAFTI